VAWDAESFSRIASTHGDGHKALQRLTAHPPHRHTPLISHSGPALQLLIIERESATASGENQHRSADQLIADVSGRVGLPRPGSDARGLGKDVVATIGDLTQLLHGLIQVAPVRGLPHGGAVQRAVEQLVLGGHALAYRMQVRFYGAQLRWKLFD
jgi:hypothetical protein